MAARSSKASSAKAAPLMLELLQAVVTEGTGKAARLLDAPVGGKTGTSQDYRDAGSLASPRNS